MRRLRIWASVQIWPSQLTLRLILWPFKLLWLLLSLPPRGLCTSGHWSPDSFRWRCSSFWNVLPHSAPSPVLASPPNLRPPPLQLKLAALRYIITFKGPKRCGNTVSVVSPRALIGTRIWTVCIGKRVSKTNGHYRLESLDPREPLRTGHRVIVHEYQELDQNLSDKPSGCIR